MFGYGALYFLAPNDNDIKLLFIIDTIRKLFTEVRYSEAGTNARMREENVYMFFVDYLDDCERGIYVHITSCNCHNESHNFPCILQSVSFTLPLTRNTLQACLLHIYSVYYRV